MIQFIKNNGCIFFHSFILFYFVYFLSWQSLNYYSGKHKLPRKLSVGVPFYINGFSYKKINGEDAGSGIDLIENIFSQINIKLDFFYGENINYYSYDCVVNLQEENCSINMLVSDCYCDTINQITIKKKEVYQQEDDEIIIVLKNNFLNYYSLVNEKNKKVIVDSVKEGINKIFELNNAIFVLDFFCLDDYKEITKNELLVIKKEIFKIKPLCMIFDESFYDLAVLVNKVIKKMNN